MKLRKHASSSNKRPLGIQLATILRVFTAIALLICFSFYYRLASFVIRDKAPQPTPSSSLHTLTQPITNTVKATVGYAVTLTSCPTDALKLAVLRDGAAVLAHSIHLSSSRNNFSSDYDYQLYAFVYQPNNTVSSSSSSSSSSSCSSVAPTLQRLGYTVLYRDVPVHVQDIVGSPFLRDSISSNGCCGEAELVKLWAYTLIQHPIIVHLDLDTLILKPMDPLFNILLLHAQFADLRRNKNSDAYIHLKQEITARWKTLPIMWPEYDFPFSFHSNLYPNQNSQRMMKLKKNTSWNKRKRLDAFFTRDYNMIAAGRKPVGVQGGFLILRPSMTVFDEWIHILRNGIYTLQGGWGDAGYGQFYGSMTFQGIVPYYYDRIQSGTAVELNRCVYNQMVDNPKHLPTKNNVAQGTCKDGRDECEDCRNRNMTDIVTVHFTLCQKPWECLSHDTSRIQQRLCRDFFQEWYRIRADLEWRLQANWNSREAIAQEGSPPLVMGHGQYEPNHFRGFCTSSGSKGYISMNIPV